MKKLTLGFLLCVGTSAWASLPISELGNELSRSVAQSESQLSCREWDLNFIHVKTGVSVAFDIPEILEVQVMPQITLIWTKD